ncbi:MAG: phosphate/phosphite/phosphonate ABC transporter substrate-binding protein [Rhizobiaceae bacterium]
MANSTSHGASAVLSILEPLIRFVHPITVLTATTLLFLGIVPGWAADWRQDIGTFRIGMIASSAPTGSGIEALRQSYSGALGMPVDFFIARDFAMLIDAQATSRIEYAIYSTTAYATAVELCQCIEPLAAPTDVDGASGIRSILIARAGKLKSVSDLPKTKVAVPAEDDLSGWLAPLSLLADGGLALRGDELFIVPAPTVLEAEAQFASGKADALLGWERVTSEGKPLPQGGTMDRLRRQGVDTGKLDLIWTSPIMSYGPHAVLKSLHAEAKTLLADFLTGLHGRDPRAYDLLSAGHAGGFVEVDDASYEPIGKIVRGITGSPP